jgi:hypothetical protein
VDPFVGAGIEDMLEATGGVPIAKGGVSSWGHFDVVPLEAHEQPGVLTSSPSLVVPAGILPGVSASSGIDEAVEVDGVEWWIWDVQPADPDGGTLRLLLRSSP